MTDTNEAAREALQYARDQHLIGLLRREGKYSGVWFSEQLLTAADRLAALTRPAPSPAPDALREAAEEAVLQLEYLDGKFAPTGTTAAVLAKLRAALTRYEESRK